MKNLFLSFLLLFTSAGSFAQADFKKSLYPVVDSLSVGIQKRAAGKKIAIAYVTNSNKNVTEFSESIMGSIMMRMVNAGIKVVDRTLYAQATAEKGLGGNNVVDLDQTVTQAKNAGIEAFVIGTYAISGSSEISLNLRAIEVKDLTIIAASEGTLPVNESIKNLLGGTLSSIGGSVATPNTERAGNAELNPLDQLFNAKISEMRPQDCNCVPMYNEKCGGICFENQMGEDIQVFDTGILLAANGGRSFDWRTLSIANSGRNCFNNIVVNSNNKDQESITIAFKFRTLGESPKFGELNLTVDIGKVKAITLTKKNLVMLKGR